MTNQIDTPIPHGTLQDAIAAHKQAWRAWKGAMHKEDDDDDAMGDAVHAEFSARLQVAMQPFANDAQFLEVLKYLVRADAKIWRHADFDNDFGATLVAVARYFGVPAKDRGRRLPR